jgi:hypothetical protein
MTVKFKLTTEKVPNGTVLMMGVSFDRVPEEGDLERTRGMAPPKTYTYALLKAGGLWYVTGSGKVPQAAGWGAIERWLDRDGRVVEWVKVATEWANVWPRDPSPEADTEPSEA